MAGLSASAAFWEHLRQLCLDQFPCGRGSWNKSRFPPRTAAVSRAPRGPGPPPRDRLVPADEETAEALTEYLSSLGSPWAPPPDCSPAEQQLRELAVQSPRDIRRGFIFSYFRSLRIVNKDVTEIDVDLLKFPNLEELILSANRISKINSTNLPPTLKVLELCGNAVGGLKDLCAPPPPQLQHLGLGRNGQLGSSEERYLTDAFWPNLVSLDLSYNNFTRLLSLLSKLLTLKKLRVLVLQGNPFALLPGYRGFTIDRLPKLCALDDVIITLDERHNFFELASSPELLRRDAKMTVGIGRLRGVPCPLGPEEPEGSPEAPVVTYSYYVTYEFARGERMEEKEAVKGQGSHHSPAPVALNVDSPAVAAPEEGGGHDPAATDTARPLELPPESVNIHSTLRKPWAETIECEYKKEHFTRDTVALKAYLLAGTTVAVVEEKIVSWPVNVTPDESPAKKGKARKKGKEKEEKGKAKDAGKGGNKKKKKSPSPELRSDPPILKTLGSVHVSLESLLAGESLVETVCDFGVLVTELRVPSPMPKEKESKKGAKKDKKSKAGAESVASRKTTPSAKGKGRKKDSPEGGDLLLSQPVPLTVEFQVQHTKWKSASQILM